MWYDVYTSADCRFQLYDHPDHFSIYTGRKRNPCLLYNTEPSVDCQISQNALLTPEKLIKTQARSIVPPWKLRLIHELLLFLS